MVCAASRTAGSALDCSAAAALRMLRSAAALRRARATQPILDSKLSSALSARRSASCTAWRETPGVLSDLGQRQILVKAQVAQFPLALREQLSVKIQQEAPLYALLHARPLHARPLASSAVKALAFTPAYDSTKRRSCQAFFLDSCAFVACPRRGQARVICSAWPSTGTGRLPCRRTRRACRRSPGRSRRCRHRPR